MIDFFCTARFREQSHFKSIIIWSWPRTIDVDSSEAEVLFEILDLSGDGSIDKEDRQGGPQTGLWARNDSDKKLRSVSLKLFGTWLKNQHLWWHFGQRIILRPWLIWNICLEFSVYRIIEMDMAQTPLPVQLGGIQVVWIAILYPQHHLAMQPSFPHHFPIIFPCHSWLSHWALHGPSGTPAGGVHQRLFTAAGCSQGRGSLADDQGHAPRCADTTCSAAPLMMTPRDDILKFVVHQFKHIWMYYYIYIEYRVIICNYTTCCNKMYVVECMDTS